MWFDGKIRIPNWILQLYFPSNWRKNLSDWILQLDLYLIWLKISWNWILPLVLDLHLIWRKNSYNWKVQLYFSFNERKIRQIEYCNLIDWFALDLTEKFMEFDTSFPAFFARFHVIFGIWPIQPSWTNFRSYTKL